jgi:trans-2,3-dihydro-3-hydroxyanthranilate isomerase
MLPFHVYDVFTSTPFTGNPLAIVEDADGLTTAQMQTIARQFNLSETIFVQTPDDPAHTAKVRIFFPVAEIPFAGHPTIGCAIHLAGDSADTITLEEVAGLVPVTITHDGTTPLAEFTAPKLPRALPHARPRDHGRGPVADRGRPRPDRLRQFRGRTLLPVCGTHRSGRARPRHDHRAGLHQDARDRRRHRRDLRLCPHRPQRIQARMFDPPAGIAEDPATGSATAILAGQLQATGALTDGTNTWTLKQGVEMGRPPTCV